MDPCELATTLYGSLDLKKKPLRMTMLPDKAIDRIFQTEVEGVTGVTQWVANFITLRNKNLLEPWGFQGQK
jgi:hypothetical protein